VVGGCAAPVTTCGPPSEKKSEATGTISSAVAGPSSNAAAAVEKASISGDAADGRP
jgi:hypothetical protein